MAQEGDTPRSRPGAGAGAGLPLEVLGGARWRGSGKPQDTWWPLMGLRAGHSLCASRVAGALAPFCASRARGRKTGLLWAVREDSPVPSSGPAHSPGAGVARTAPSHNVSAGGQGGPSEQLPRPHSPKQDRERQGQPSPPQRGRQVVSLRGAWVDGVRSRRRCWQQAGAQGCGRVGPLDVCSGNAGRGPRRHWAP